MIQYRPSMDPHSLDVYRDGKFIAFAQWHPERQPRVVMCNNNNYLTLCEMKSIVELLQIKKELRTP